MTDSSVHVILELVPRHLERERIIQVVTSTSVRNALFRSSPHGFATEAPGTFL